MRLLVGSKVGGVVATYGEGRHYSEYHGRYIGRIFKVKEVN